ncbi:hypothetical protein [Paenibacillus sp. An7]|uniref:hypothetical protein n=1 Tax=Paenibacillus sp. An7 TaxID=2689577 RepID=UPI001357C700|nr:hypothetical protein [Paenibacillus sp. An7]
MVLGIQQLSVKEFDLKHPPFEHPELEQFHYDLLSGFEMVPDYERLKKGNNNSYHIMGAALLDEERWQQVINEVDLFVMAYSFPNIRPDISIVNYLMDRYGGNSLNFAINDMGFASPFMALHIIRQYLEEHLFQKAILLVMDQTSLAYKMDELQGVDCVDTGAVLLIDNHQGSKGNILDIHMGHIGSLDKHKLHANVDEFLKEKGVSVQDVLFLAHPSLATFIDSSYEVIYYEKTRWSAAPFLALSTLMKSHIPFDHVCVLHYEKDDDYLYKLLLRM